MIRRTAVPRAVRAPMLLLACTAAACGNPTPSGPSPRPGPSPSPSPAPAPPTANYAGFPGFDTGIYPGDAAMRAWRQTSPYVWVGYYLAAPCHRDVSWQGKRDALIGMGWGQAVIYLGQQDWAAMPSRAPAQQPDTLRRDSTAAAQPSAATTPVTPAQSQTPGACSAANLSAGRGATDAADAIAKTAAEGFPSSSVIYLDVERVQAVSPALVEYVRGWVDAVLADGRYRPGIYCHRLNADALADAARGAYTARGRSDAPPFWVTSSAGFALEQPPTGVGLPYATIWQGRLDTRESWGGYDLTIDQNVAASRSPSSPR
jgi:hypothetical protein